MTVRVHNGHGSVVTTARLDDTLRPGVVAMTHGLDAANVNALSPVGPGTFDPVSAMSQLTGIPVSVEPLD